MAKFVEKTMAMTMRTYSAIKVQSKTQTSSRKMIEDDKNNSQLNV
jgi:hypothetical protein